MASSGNKACGRKGLPLLDGSVHEDFALEDNMPCGALDAEPKKGEVHCNISFATRTGTHDSNDGESNASTTATRTGTSSSIECGSSIAGRNDLGSSLDVSLRCAIDSTRFWTHDVVFHKIGACACAHAESKETSSRESLASHAGIHDADSTAQANLQVQSPRSPKTAGRALTNDSVRSGCDDSAALGEADNSEVLQKIVLRRKRRSLSTQASGHGGRNFLKEYTNLEDFKIGVPDMVLKTYDPVEHQSYQKLQANADSLQAFTPRFFGKLSHEDGSEHLKLSNLLRTFRRGPTVMDCKLGARSFTENEITNTKLRKDLYQRLIALDPSYPSKDEHEAAACTKHRWMEFNDKFTTLSSLGFRIDGITSSSGAVANKLIRQARSFADLANLVIEHFLPTLSPGLPLSLEGSDFRRDELQLRRQVVASINQQLQELSQAMRSSEFLAKHSLVGSSLLFVAERHECRARVFLIDFAKVETIPSGCMVTHERPWQPGNYEDEIYTGLKNITRCWELVGELLSR